MLEPRHIFAACIRPDHLQYLIFYTRPNQLGWRVAQTWSADSLDYVRQWFRYDYYRECPQVLAVVAISNN